MPSARGRGLIGGALFLIIVGALLNISELAAMAGALVALCVLSYGVALVSTRRLTVRCEAPGLVATGQPFDLSVALGGTRLTHQMRFEVHPRLPDGLELLEVEKQEEHGHEVVWRCQAVARARGAYQAGDMTVIVEDPAGLVKLRARASTPREVLVWPRPLEPDGRLSLLTGDEAAGYQDTGKRANAGSSIYGVRPWAPGDSSRRVHWPSTARLGKIAVLEFEADSAVDLLVVLDVRAPASQESFETACRAASFLLHERWAAGQQARLATGGQMAGEQSGRPGALPRMEALAALAKARADSRKPLALAVRELGRNRGAAGNAILVTTRWDTDAREALAALAHFHANATVMIAGAQGAQKLEPALAAAAGS